MGMRTVCELLQAIKSELSYRNAIARLNFHENSVTARLQLGASEGQERDMPLTPHSTGDIIFPKR